MRFVIPLVQKNKHPFFDSLMRYSQLVLRSLGQVMFQNNVYSGLLFLIGIFYNSIFLGCVALLGTLVSNGAAQLLNYPKEDVENGLYGFNGALIGIALGYYFGFTPIVLLAIVLSAALTSMLFYHLKRLIPPFTAPFVILAWMVIYLLLVVFNLPLVRYETPIETGIDFLSVVANGFGQVMFQENSITGLLFILAILVNSKLSAIYGLYAASLGALLGLLLDEPISGVNAGLMGYNAILCAIALVDHKLSTFLWITTATILAVLLTLAFAKTGIFTLTAPFILSTWVIQRIKNFKKEPILPVSMP